MKKTEEHVHTFSSNEECPNKCCICGEMMCGARSPKGLLGPKSNNATVGCSLNAGHSGPHQSGHFPDIPSWE